MNLEEEKNYKSLLTKKDFKIGFCDLSFVVIPYTINEVDLPFLTKNEYGYSFNNEIHDVVIDKVIVSHYSKFTYFFTNSFNLTFEINTREIKSEECYFCFIDTSPKLDSEPPLTKFRLVSKDAMDLNTLNVTVKDLGDSGSKTKGVRL